MTRTISAKTKICGIIGDPVEHSMSPAMHNAAFNETGLDFVYVAFHVKPEGLSAAVKGMKELGITGFNVTIPHKIQIIPMLDEIDPQADKIGAVNTVVNDAGKLVGYNTDASGFIRAMMEKGLEPEGKNIVVLGAGGASRAVSLSLADSKAKVTILNRVSGMDRANKLAASITEATGYDVHAFELNERHLEEMLETAEVLVNTTSVGMSPNTDDSPVPAALLRPELVVYDIVYNPVKTRLLRDAEAAGAKTISGVDMLVWQGVTAFEKWTGVTAPSDLMKREVLKALSS